VLGAVIAVIAVFAVARPFLSEPATSDDDLESLSDADEHRLALAEERDRALGALKELEFDHRTGKISDEDYKAALPPLRRRVADAVRAEEVGAEAASEHGAERNG
jgi:hypothetical protein